MSKKEKLTPEQKIDFTPEQIEDMQDNSIIFDEFNERFYKLQVKMPRVENFLYIWVTNLGKEIAKFRFSDVKEEKYQYLYNDRLLKYGIKDLNHVPDNKLVELIAEKYGVQIDKEKLEVEQEKEMNKFNKELETFWNDVKKRISEIYEITNEQVEYLFKQFSKLIPEVDLTQVDKYVKGVVNFKK